MTSAERYEDAAQQFGKDPAVLGTRMTPDGRLWERAGGAVGRYVGGREAFNFYRAQCPWVLEILATRGEEIFFRVGADKLLLHTRIAGIWS